MGARLAVLVFVGACGRIGFDPTPVAIPACTSPAIASLATLPAGSQPRAVALADLNRDGALDIVATNGGDGTFSVLLGRSDGTFQPQALRAAGGAQPYSLATGDFDRDGNVDVAIGLYTTNAVAVFLGTGGGALDGPTLYATATSPQAVAVGDVDGDGKLDLVVTANGSNAISVLGGNGDGTFGAHVDYATGAGPYDVELADLDGDGLLDAVTTNVGDATISVLRGQAGGTFAAHVDTTVGVATTRPWHVAIGDLDGDLHADLAVANAFGPDGDKVGVLLGHGDATFSPVVLYPGPSPWWIEIVDLDRDGTADLVTADGASNAASVYSGLGDGTFAARRDYMSGAGANSLAIGDLDRDGSMDLVLVDDSPSNDLTVLLSRCGPNAGSLLASSASQTADVDLTATGTADWSHWGLVDTTSFDHKQPGGQITIATSGPVTHYTNNGYAFSWSDGTPTASVVRSPTGIYVENVGSSLQITAPADPSPRTLRVYADTYLVTATVTAELSDASAPAYTDAVFGTLGATVQRAYTFEYHAGSSGQSLVVTFAIDQTPANGNVAVAAATLTEP